MTFHTYTNPGVIALHQGHQVLAQRHEIMFRDGSTVGVHPVATGGAVQMFLRALHCDGPCWVVFDLRHTAPEIEADVLRLLPRDTPGVVFYTLRGLFPTAAAFAAAVQRQALARCAPVAQALAA